MSHWAELDKNNKVIRVLVGDNNDPAGDEGYQWLIDNLGGTWVQTSYNGKIRYNFAGIGYTYFSDADAFVAPKPECGHPELTLNQTNYQWECNNPEHEEKLNA
jgi:hypothetical protein